MKLYEGEGIIKELKGLEIPEDCLGMIYICEYDHKNKTIMIVNALGFQSPGAALNAYSEIPNPESQVAYGKTREEFEKELQKLHDNLSNPEWVKSLEGVL